MLYKDEVNCTSPQPRRVRARKSFWCTKLTRMIWPYEITSTVWLTREWQLPHWLKNRT